VLSTAPSLRSDSPPTFDGRSKALRRRGPNVAMEKSIVTVLVLDFLIALAVGIAAAAIMAFILINVVIGWFKKSRYHAQRSLISGTKIEKTY